jgi:hypothetical protein
LILVLPACAPNLSEQVLRSAGWPKSLDSFTVAWTAEPGVDLTTDGAVVATRAYVESFLLASMADDDKYVYPGFADAVERDQPSGPPGARNLHPELGSTSPNTYIGTMTHHVLGVAHAGVDVTVSACVYTFGAAIGQAPGEYDALVGDAFVAAPGIYPMRVGLRAPSDQSAKLPPQQGPSRTPSDDVFGGWKITSLEGGFLSTVRWADYDRDRSTCIAKATGLPGSERVQPHQPSSAIDFPALPPTPGWPEKPAG